MNFNELLKNRQTIRADEELQRVESDSEQAEIEDQNGLIEGHTHPSVMSKTAWVLHGAETENEINDEGLTASEAYQKAYDNLVEEINGAQDQAEDLVKRFEILEKKEAINNDGKDDGQRDI